VSNTILAITLERRRQKVDHVRPGSMLGIAVSSVVAEEVSIMSMLKTLVVLLATVIICAGCAGSYYKVTDPANGKVFYTEEVKRNGSAVEFKDATTGSIVTLQNSEVTQIDKSAYQSAVPEPKK